jgi:hypothetical protein
MKEYLGGVITNYTMIKKNTHTLVERKTDIRKTKSQSRSGLLQLWKYSFWEVGKEKRFLGRGGEGGRGGVNQPPPLPQVKALVVS